ncbi:hypothetical protein HK105_201238 [Polyrhizophydium stewartii]|uniref:Beta-1,4-mannosyl-glycoprotein beta-1,4-N-acetylglucosaminyltransferase n=1 Tax=Polyrhizophydium stewartii TaxID=2732419 RepID=A0ABR4NHH0_9FUNG|nr:hypothetical protein HK105_002823 [Polyrhizophydium stewartii]
MLHGRRACPQRLGPRRLRLVLLGLAAFAVLATTLAVLLLSPTMRYVYGTVTSVTRPLWDTPERPFRVIPHYYAPHVSWETLCRRHGWAPLGTGDRMPRAVDAILFSVEVDLLEIRIRELYDVVEKFVVLETNSTFTGLPKAFTFEQHRERFAFAADKIVYKKVHVRPLGPKEDPFRLEVDHRVHMGEALKDADVGLARGDWVIMTDVDEIPSWHTVRLMRSCKGIPSPLHLQLRNYIYSFEFFVDMGSWRAKMVRFPTGYAHYRASDVMLADAGWHCSFCFRRIADFVFKMVAFSHADRLTSKAQLDPARIQKIVCEGSDIFDMLPEAWSFRDMVRKWGPVERQSSAVGLPGSLVEHADRFAFLLPGGCMRNESAEAA